MYICIYVYIYIYLYICNQRKRPFCLQHGAPSHRLGCDIYIYLCMHTYIARWIDGNRFRYIKITQAPLLSSARRRLARSRLRRRS